MGSTSSAPRRRYAQSYLDDGVLERCNLCQMRYSRGVAEDESLHRRHCKRFRLGVKWPSGEGDMLRSFPDGSRLVVTTHMTAAVSCGRNVCSLPRWGLMALAQVRDALEVVDTELGFADCEEGAPGDHLPQTVYVVVSDARRVVGVAVVVPIERGFRVIASPADNGDGDGDGDHNVMASRDAERAAVGVSRIWVHRDHRRHGIGSRLLEAVHSHTGVPDRQLLALSQPTAMGAALARKWFGRSDFLLMK